MRQKRPIESSIQDIAYLKPLHLATRLLCIETSVCRICTTMNKVSYVCMYACMYACMHVCMYACMHVCMYACMHVCMNMHEYACMYACMHVRMHVCMYVRTKFPNNQSLEFGQT